MISDADLLAALPLRRRLALSYAPAAVHGQWLALLALDARLASVLRQAREPLLAQVRLAWWRDRLSEAPESWPDGEPLLAALQAWQGQASALVGLVDAWEGLIEQPPLPATAMLALAEGRGLALAGLAGAEQAAEALRMGRNWGLADLAGHLSDPAECEAALSLARAQDWRAARMPRALRPLAVLHALAARDLRLGGKGDKTSPASLLVAMRAGLLGR